MGSPTPHHLLPDALRGAAALWVVLFHASYLWQQTRSAEQWPLLASLLQNGWRGVDVFFVVSGFFIAQSAARSSAIPGGAGLFVLNRCWRIFPTYWVALVGSLVLALAASPFNERPIFGGAQAVLGSTFWQLPMDLLLIAPWLGAKPLLEVSWTLTHELAFYGIVAVGVGVTAGARFPLISILGSLVAAMQVMGVLDLPPPLRLWPEFLCGWLAGEAALNPRKSAPGAYRRILTIGAFGLCGVLLGYERDMLPACALISLALILSRRFDGAWGALPLIATLGSLGTASYSTYLVHSSVVNPLQNLAMRFGLLDHDWSVLLPFAFSVVAISFGVGFHHTVESRFERARQHAFKTHLNPLPAP